MKKLPKISIIIPVYNVEPYIAECLQSVMRQTYSGEIECILVDDCGTDGSIAVAEQIIEDYTIANQKLKIKNPISFRIIHHECNRGPTAAAARNTGTAAATGDYILYLDSDDYLSDDCIEILAQPLQEYGYDVVVGGMKSFGGKQESGEPSRTSGAILSNQAVFDAFYGKKMFWGVVWNRLIKRSLLNTHDLNFMEGQICEDELWMYKCSVAVESLYVQDEVTYYYRIRGDGVMGKTIKDTEKLTKSHYASIDYVLSHPANVASDIWNEAVLYYMGMYTSASIQLFKNTWPQYYSLRKRIDYHPLRDWRKGKLAFKDLRHRFAYVLPPCLGYVYLKIRKLKQMLLSCYARYIS